MSDSFIPKKFKHYTKNAARHSESEKTDDDDVPLEKPMVGLRLDSEEDPYVEQPPGTSSKRDTPVPGQKSVLPTPPGSPEEVRGWSPNVDHPVTSSVVAPPSDRDVVSVARPLALDDMVEAAQTRLRLLSSFPNVSIVSGDLGHDSVIARALASSTPKRMRGEKKAIPDEQKDTKYYERRKRNNLAAKKSRDARKSREDQIALRANLLEKENAILRAQVATLREEANSLRQLLIQKRNNRPPQ